MTTDKEVEAVALAICRAKCGIDLTAPESLRRLAIKDHRREAEAAIAALDTLRSKQEP